MKKIKILFILSIFTLMLASCSGKIIVKDGLNQNPETGKYSLIKTNEFIDMNETSVKFLFKAKVGNTIEIFMGTDKDSLKSVKKILSYDNKGFIIDNLTAGTTYFYKISSSDGVTTQESDVLDFVKSGNIANWAPAEWARETVFYEVFVRSFYDSNGNGVGDFKGLKEKIPYFKDLGVEALWLMPINDSPSYHGYDVKNYRNTEPDYGTMAEFKDFLAEAKANNIKVIMDLVVNHSSSEHEWFVDAAKGNNSQFRDYYVWLNEYENKFEKGDWGQNVWATRPNVPDSYYAVFWDGMPDLNFRNPKVRDEIINVAKFWLDQGVDGFRLDAALHIDNQDKAVTHSFWQQFNTEIKKHNPNAFLVGETWTDPATMAPFFKDLDSSFNFFFSEAMMSTANGDYGDILSYLKTIHNVYGASSSNFIDSTFLGNHDKDRVATILGNDKDKIKLAASLLLTLPGTPFIYYGEELGQKGLKSKDEYVREPFDWYKSAKGTGMTVRPNSYTSLAYTVANDGISLEEQKGDSTSMFEHYKKLIEIRKNNKALYNVKNYEPILNLPSRMYGYQVGNLYIIHNLNNEIRSLNSNSPTEDILNAQNGTDINIGRYGTVILNSATPLSVKEEWKTAYFRGSTNSWGATPMTKIARHIWEIKVTFGAGVAEFKIERTGQNPWSDNYPEKNVVLESNSKYRITFTDTDGTINCEKLPN